MVGRRSAFVLSGLIAAAVAVAYTNEEPTFPAEPLVGYGFCSCPARPEAIKVQAAIFSTKPTADQGPIFVCDCAYDDEPLLNDPRLESVCSAWATPTDIGGVLMAPACIAQTYMENDNHREFGPCDASCGFHGVRAARPWTLRRAARRLRKRLVYELSGRYHGPAHGLAERRPLDELPPAP